MADYVEQAMQDMVHELDDLRRKKIFNEEELRIIVKRRRDFEYALQKTPSKRVDYLNYIRYEVALECLRKRRSKALHWRSKSMSDYAGVRRLHSVFDRGVKKFKGDLRFWYQYIDFCLRSGSTKVMSRVLIRALKFHPREVRLWLLAADRELKCGNIKAARTLLLRGLRFAPLSPKLWGEFLRLESRVACHMFASRHTGREAELPGVDKSTSSNVLPTENAFAPARLLLCRALGRLDTNPKACAVFLATATTLVEQAYAVAPAHAGLDQWAEEVKAAIAARRPGIAEGTEWAEAKPEVAAAIWELWWKQERAKGADWSSIVAVVVASAPVAALQLCATVITEAACDGEDDGTAAKALLELATAPRAAEDAQAALAILELLERFEEVSMSSGKTTSVANKLLQRAAEAHPSCGRLALLAAKQLPAGKGGGADVASVIDSAYGMDPLDAARLLLVALQAEAAPATTLERLICSLSKEASPQAVVEAFMAEALARGPSCLQEALRCTSMVASQLWDLPVMRTQFLSAVLHVILRVQTPTAMPARWVCDSFEELLTAVEDEDEKVDWWTRYVAFVQRAARWGVGSGIPSATDLHWRAMKAVANQAAYTERVQQISLSGAS